MKSMNKKNTSAHVIIGLSGGVDSSVAAYLLKQAGHHVEAVFMKNWEEEDATGFCPAEADFKEAQAVCDLLDIPLTLVNFSSEYWERVFTYFLEEYQAGRTPNPDILCNKEIKFSAFLDYAKNKGADFIATGHYARIQSINHQTCLLKGKDPGKDQSYFLHALSNQQLTQSLFPIGHLQKPAVRALAKEIGLANHNKKDSTGICFIGERKFNTFLNAYLPAKPGLIETIDGEPLGEHAGLMFYTIGQRQGLNIGGKRNKAELPWYVANKDIARNVLQVVQGDQHPALFKTSLTLSHLHWINEVPPDSNVLLTAKIRYRQTDQPCRLHLLNEHQARATFDQPQRAITPGQAIVFYHDDICLGGGIIED